MSYILKWTKKEIEAFQVKLILDIYYQFCADDRFRMRSQASWEAGWDTIKRVGVGVNNSG